MPASTLTEEALSPFRGSKVTLNDDDASMTVTVTILFVVWESAPVIEIIAVPSATAVTAPVVESTVATLVSLDE